MVFYSAGFHPWQRREYSNLLNPVTIAPSETKQAHLREGITITASQVLQSVKAVKARKAEGCNETHLKCSEP